MNFPNLTEKEQHNLTFDIIDNPELLNKLKQTSKQIKKIDLLSDDEKIILKQEIKNIKTELKCLYEKNESKCEDLTATKIIYILIIIFVIIMIFR
jgi:hypothetical protein